MVPRGTLLRTGIGDDSTHTPLSLVTATLWVRSPRKSTIHSMMSKWKLEAFFSALDVQLCQMLYVSFFLVFFSMNLCKPPYYVFFLCV